MSLRRTRDTRQSGANKSGKSTVQEVERVVIDHGVMPEEEEERTPVIDMKPITPREAERVTSVVDIKPSQTESSKRF